MSVLIQQKKNIVLIGMPGAGKSTVGVVLAKNLGFHFVDSDLLIQSQQKRLLHEIITKEGVEAFLDIENNVNASITESGCVIATGGSVVYGKDAMMHLKKDGLVIYLSLSYPEIRERLGDLKERGVAMRDGQSLLDLYHERTPLYEKYADLTINCGQAQIRHIVDRIVCEAFV